ncbi:AraC family transcriptional regulator, partial [bacterium]|nr:AraC family transcriptional regulator [bacterium]
MASIQKLMIRAERVIKINGATKVTVSKKIRHLLEITDLQRIVVLLEIMDYLSKSDDVETLVSESSIKHFTAQDSDDRVHRIYHYIEENLNNSITLEKAASVANMSKTGFCRYFKYTTGETFSTYVNEVRIEYACKLLIEGKWNIAQIGYRCGFHQPSYFDRIFKNITSKTPLEFQAQFNALVDKDQNLSTRFPAKCDK